MSPLFPDTSHEAEEVLVRLLRETPPWRKFEMVNQMSVTVRKLNRIGMQKRFQTILRKKFSGDWRICGWGKN
jgi:hypothetical protein